MVAGGVLLRHARVPEFEAAIQQIKNNAGIVGEMKWSKYKGGAREAAYKAVVDLCFDAISRRVAALHLIIANFAEFDHRSVLDGSPEGSVNRMYYQLCLHRIGQIYGSKCAIVIHPDAGNDSREIISFREAICAGAYKRYDARPNCIRAIQPLSSEEHHVLQMVDIVVGAVAASRNGRELAAPKADLAAYVLERSGRRSWAINTKPTGRFTVWNFRHQERSRLPRHEPRPSQPADSGEGRAAHIVTFPRG